MTNELIPARLLRWLLWDWLELETLLSRSRFAEHDRGAIEAAIDMAAGFAATEVASVARAVDRDPPTCDAAGNVRVHPASAHAVRGFAGNGFFATLFDTELGGLQLPNLVHSALFSLGMAGDVATASYILLTVGNARLIVEKGSAAQIEAFARPQIAGTALGTMCLSESHAGSSLGGITTKATLDGEDELGQRYRIHGSKMWISAADHNITEDVVHLVLAKIADDTGHVAEGTRGISLFIVPKRLPDGAPNDITIVGLNHKLGQRGLPNCAVNFGEGRHHPQGTAGAVGWLIGEAGKGLAHMFQMMNDARVAVGLGSAALAMRGYQLSLAYARERVQGTVAGRPAAIIEHPDVKRMLLAQKALAEGALALGLFGARLLDDEQTAPTPAERARAAALLRLLTPIIKTWPAEFGQESLSHAVQIFGGAGYTTDHEVEKLYRDNRLNPIHEGTTGIQGIDLVSRKLWKDRGADYRLLREEMGESVASARHHPGLAPAADALAAALATLDAAVAWALAAPQPDCLLPVATPMLFAFGHVVVGWLWLDQAVKALSLAFGTGPDQAFYAGRTRACSYFAQFELPRVAAWLSPTQVGAGIVAEMALDGF